MEIFNKHREFGEVTDDEGRNSSVRHDLETKREKYGKM